MAAPKDVLLPTEALDEAPGALVVETERLEIRRLAPKDLEALAAIILDPGVNDNLNTHFELPEGTEDPLGTILEKLQAFYELRATAPNPSQVPVQLAFFAKPGAPSNENGTQPILIGNMILKTSLDITYRTFGTGYLIRRESWGVGYGTEAISAVVNYCFRTWPQLQRIEAEVYQSNLGSLALLKKVGFQEEGRRRQAATKKGNTYDVVVFGIIRDDLKA